jgi:hypothetical protein
MASTTATTITTKMNTDEYTTITNKKFNNKLTIVHQLHLWVLPFLEVFSSASTLMSVTITTITTTTITTITTTKNRITNSQ